MAPYLQTPSHDPSYCHGRKFRVTSRIDCRGFLPLTAGAHTATPTSLNTAICRPLISWHLISPPQSALFCCSAVLTERPRSFFPFGPALVPGALGLSGVRRTGLDLKVRAFKRLIWSAAAQNLSFHCPVCRADPQVMCLRKVHQSRSRRGSERILQLVVPGDTPFLSGGTSAK